MTKKLSKIVNEDYAQISLCHSTMGNQELGVFKNT